MGSVQENFLTGTLPWTDIAKFPLLAVIEMLGNELTGGLEEAMGQITTMQIMDLQFNQLDGTIPTSIGNLTDIMALQLGGNQLSGTLPSELGNLRNLEALIFNDNYSLNGTSTIPTAKQKAENDNESFIGGRDGCVQNYL
jgi:Leucine-rich repeat (LRR) protein